MKFISYEWNGTQTYGVYDENTKLVWDLRMLGEKAGILLPDTLAEAIAKTADLYGQANKWLAAAGENEKALAAADEQEIRWLAPIPRPAKNVMCIGKNYRDHAIEMGGEESIPEHMLVFTKSPTAVIGCEEDIPAHADLTDALDYEGELAVVIGKRGKEISRGEAFDYIFGYTIINDVTARDIQKRHKQFFLGKSLDGTCPMGPWIVPKEEIATPHQLAIETKVNGEIRQRSNTEHLIFPIDEMIAVLSKGMTLEPGDIIATGTPSGVGYGMNPPRMLKPGDTVEITIKKIGTLANKVR
ncbi:fumarylacetoacetate hydrolase family protein [Bacillus xiapuensis]|uniref:fumarylacetoacetate hydrolase family protein n=1 Tax=Bacillus xiapuensis TaxID=2014075 RepID=UPI000C23D6FD|nr:fumarylacetoacetate hydrolase family protein [Bacillus xiapuensis]